MCVCNDNREEVMCLRGNGGTGRVLMEIGKSEIDANLFLVHKVNKNTKLK